MKIKIHLLLLLAVLLFLTACENTQVAANYSGNTNGADGIVSAQITGDLSTNAAAGLQGSYNVDTGDYTVGFIVTLKQAPGEFARQQFLRAGGINNGETTWVFPDPSATAPRTNAANPDLVAIALKAAGDEPGGASIVTFAKTQP